MTAIDWLSLVWPFVVFLIGGQLLGRRLSEHLDDWMAL